jgi:hypothetical protein
MTKFYLIKYSNKHKGWVIEIMSQNYNYTKMPKSPTFTTIEDAENFIRPLHDTYGYWIDHKIENHIGHLVTLEDWKETCDDGGFIDYDGYGDQVNSQYAIVGDSVCPSDHTKNRKDAFHVDTKYILWYNR